MIFNGPGLMKELTLQITIQAMPQLRFRLWLFKGIMRFAIWIGGFGGIEFVEQKDE